MNGRNIQLNPLFKSEKYTLCDETLQLAADYLTGKYFDRMFPADFSLEEYDLPAEERHGKCAVLIAQKVPLEINPAELLAGNAPLKEAISHRIPALSAPGSRNNFSCISHTTVDFIDAVKLGLSGLEKEINGYKSHAPEYKHAFYNGTLHTIRAMRIWCRRYIG